MVMMLFLIKGANFDDNPTRLPIFPIFLNGQIAASGDQVEIATYMEYVRATLIALAQQPNDVEFDLPNATINTKTAALILRIHPEHLRHIIRQEQLPAVKENGEYRIFLRDIADFMGSGRSLYSTMTAQSVIKDVEEGRTVVLWERPAEGSG